MEQGEVLGESAGRRAEGLVTHAKRSDQSQRAGCPRAQPTWPTASAQTMTRDEPVSALDTSQSPWGLARGAQG